jgi:hypothetical protein
MKFIRSCSFFLTLYLLTACDTSSVDPISLPSFTATPNTYTLAENLLHGASGIVPSFHFDRSLWVHNDHDPHLYLLSSEGKLQKKLPFAGTSRDWEDIAIGPGPEAGKNYIYLGEIGDNNESYGSYKIFRFPEPTDDQQSINEYETIGFTYSDGKSYDVEAMLLDPATKDLYLLTKRQIIQSHLFRLSYPQKTDAPNVAQLVKTIPYGMFTGGDISPDGKEILLKNYSTVYYWKLRNGESVSDALGRKHDLNPPYLMEPQGEAICFDKIASSYYTISEKGNSPEPVKLFQYLKSSN